MSADPILETKVIICLTNPICTLHMEGGQ